tara:strand:- start:278 stop:532 length:255 start_codon:yes stop_codon:yes gene_type:complete
MVKIAITSNAFGEVSDNLKEGFKTYAKKNNLRHLRDEIVENKKHILFTLIQAFASFLAVNTFHLRGPKEQNYKQKFRQSRLDPF